MNYKPVILSLTLLTACAVWAKSPNGMRLKAHTEKPNSARTITDVYEMNAVDVPPEFPGGNNAMVYYINRERTYPEGARNDGAYGRVLCGFVVNTDGAISHITVMRKVHPDLDREAVRIIENMPRWSAGIRHGENVPVFYLLPITFRQ
ncbi:MAG: energy transducer TonB [Muribaculaceae bacterium]|nr:energy transducer TonB [Muribaculaceae bacterium]